MVFKLVLNGQFRHTSDLLHFSLSAMVTAIQIKVLRAKDLSSRAPEIAEMLDPVVGWCSTRCHIKARKVKHQQDSLDIRVCIDFCSGAHGYIYSLTVFVMFTLKLWNTRNTLSPQAMMKNALSEQPECISINRMCSIKTRKSSVGRRKSFQSGMG